MLKAYTDASITRDNHASGAVVLVAGRAHLDSVHLFNFGKISIGNTTLAEKLAIMAAARLAPAGRLAMVFCDCQSALGELHYFQDTGNIHEFPANERVKLQMLHERQPQVKLERIQRNRGYHSFAHKFAALAHDLPIGEHSVTIPKNIAFFGNDFDQAEITLERR